MKTDFEKYKLIHDFMYPIVGLKSWITENCYNNVFKEDWNVLMEVIKKIEAFTDNENCSMYNFKQESVFVEIIDNHTSETIVELDADTKREAAYNAVVEFIEWQDKNSII